MAAETIDTYQPTVRDDEAKPQIQKLTIEELQPPHPCLYGEVRPEVCNEIARILAADPYIRRPAFD